ncbi:cyclic AMP-responsive element-binding protein 5 [Copidosoma floridanum]|uniref:cyclic AMP-responsive element-binding protein 5 n=1 Tax=Copidosoma floridanum TaxID=29053 RepID=UPI0006C950C0|nr:cyclic AMP-responsive element-binding protein 5 [Copidosoma floridanum]
MNDSVKPFACIIAGCNMSFINEDHLTVHKKKHDMMLNLGINSKNNFFIADQTPTPTRFIRNCDDVGLFQDLQSDNPFEETFRRAVEAGKSGELTVPEVHENDDTLHTPNIFPHITEECAPSVSTQSNKITKSESSIDLESVSNKSAHIEDSSTICENKSSEDNFGNVSSNSAISQSLSSSPTNDNSIDKPETHVPINVNEMQILLKTESGNVLRFVAAPTLDSMNSVSLQPKLPAKSVTVTNANNKTDIEMVSDQKLLLAKMKLKQTLTKNGVVIENKSIQNNKNASVDISKEKSKIKVDGVKKQAIKERNRASSMRARAKRKVWIEQLQNSLKNANETNANLHAQLKNLHCQIDKLKTLLLAHKDCPVTKAMEKGNRIIVSSKVIALKSSTLESIKPIKRASTEKLIAPKKKSIVLPTVMSPIIIPTTNSTPNTITLHAAEAVKSIPTINIVTPLGTSIGNAKTILSFLPTDSEKVKANRSFSENTGGLTLT